jgi:predicted phosphohydrolase
MRLWILSDLHLEDGTPLPYAAPEFDVLVCAGDVVEGSPARSVEAVAHLAGGRPAVLVLGNHDVWWQTLEGALEEARAHGARLGVHVLEDTAVNIDGVRFHGATLWTGSLGSGPETADPDQDVGEPVHLRGSVLDRRAKVQDILAITQRSQEAIAKAVAKAKDDRIPLVVVTHYSPRSSRPPADPVDPGQVDLPTSGATLWVYGHVHQSVDVIDSHGTRIVCNARGGRIANAAFDSGLIVVVSQHEG